MVKKKKSAIELDCAFEIGQAYFIRTVTNYITGRVIAVLSQDLVLENAAWIADTGRFANSVQTGVFSEIEPYPDNVPVIVGRGSIVDAYPMTAALPRNQK